MVDCYNVIISLVHSLLLCVFLILSFYHFFIFASVSPFPTFTFSFVFLTFLQLTNSFSFPFYIFFIYSCVFHNLTRTCTASPSGEHPAKPTHLFLDASKANNLNGTSIYNNGLWFSLILFAFLFYCFFLILLMAANFVTLLTRLSPLFPSLSSALLNNNLLLFFALF